MLTIRRQMMAKPLALLIAVLMVLVYTVGAVPTVYADNGTKAHIHLSNELKGLKSNIEKLIVEDKDGGEAELTHLQGNHFLGNLAGDFPSNSKDVVVKVTVVWKDGSESWVYSDADGLTQSAVGKGNGTVNVWLNGTGDVGPDEEEFDIEVIKAVDKSKVKVDDEVTFTITVTNFGPDDAREVIISDNLPAGLEFVSADPSTGSYDEDRGEWSIPVLENGDSATLTMVAKAVETGRHKNIATFIGEDYDSSNNSNSAKVKVIEKDNPVDPEGFDIAVTKTVDNSSVEVGDDVTFTVTVVNNGPDAAEGVVISDVLPSELTFVSAVASVGSYSAETENWTIGSMEKDASATLTMVAKAVETGTHTNTAVFIGSDNDYNNDNDSASAAVVVTEPSNPDPTKGSITITKQVQPAGPVPVLFTAEGDGPEFSFTITGPGFGDGQTFPLEDGGSKTFNNLDFGTYKVVEADHPDYTADESEKEATINSDNKNETINFVNRPKPVDPPEEGFDIAVTKTVDDSSVYVNAEVTFTVTVKNNGPDDVGFVPQMAPTAMNLLLEVSPGVVIEDLLPDGLEFVSAAPSTGSYDEESGNWNIPFLGSGDSVTLTMVAKAVSSGTHTNTAEFIGQDRNSENNSDSASVNVRTRGGGGGDSDNPRIRVTKEVSADGGATWQDANTGNGPDLAEGTAPLFRFTVRNTGDVTLRNVTLTDDTVTVPALNADQSTLSVGEEFSVTVTGVWTAGKHTNTATAAGEFGNRTVSDTDIASFYGVTDDTGVAGDSDRDGSGVAGDSDTVEQTGVAGDKDVPQTGEASSIALLFGLMIASGAGIVALARRRTAAE